MCGLRSLINNLEKNEISGFFDLRYKMGITAFGKAQKCRYVGDIPRFGNNFATTIYGIASIFEKVLRFLSVLLTFQKL